MGSRVKHAASPDGPRPWAEGQPNEPWPVGRKLAQQPDFFLIFLELFNYQKWIQL
jgi:hypothetical protein